MGTTFASLQIRSNSVHEIEKVLSGSIVSVFQIDGLLNIDGAKTHETRQRRARNSLEKLSDGKI